MLSEKVLFCTLNEKIAIFQQGKNQRHLRRQRLAKCYSISLNIGRKQVKLEKFVH